MREPTPGMCPFCGDQDIVGDACDVEGEYMYQEMSCSACDKSWADEYRLIRQVDEGETVTIKEEGRLIPILEEFMADVEAVASSHELDNPDAFDWPDLIVTYQKARAILKEEK